jgi:hypothetical protein
MKMRLIADIINTVLGKVKMVFHLMAIQNEYLKEETI